MLRHSLQEVSKRPVLEMMVYPARMAVAVEIGSWPALEKAMASFSWVNTVWMGLSVFQGSFMVARLASSSAAVMVP